MVIPSGLEVTLDEAAEDALEEKVFHQDAALDTLDETRDDVLTLFLEGVVDVIWEVTPFSDERAPELSSLTVQPHKKHKAAAATKAVNRLKTIKSPPELNHWRWVIAQQVNIACPTVKGLPLGCDILKAADGKVTVGFEV